MLNEEEYYNYYYDKGKTIDQIAKTNNVLNERQLLSKYNKYIVKEEKKYNRKFVKDEKWLETKLLVKKRDKETCQLMSKLPFALKQELIENSNGLYKILDPAHRIGRGANVRKKYYVSNVWTLNRFSHSMLDTQKSPVNGKMITKEEHDSWWELITGEISFSEFNIESSK